VLARTSSNLPDSSIPESFWRLPESSGSIILSWMPWDLEPRITVLARTNSYLAGRQVGSCRRFTTPRVVRENSMAVNLVGFGIKNDYCGENQEQSTRADRPVPKGPTVPC
jgi:hypothetical protein